MISIDHDSTEKFDQTFTELHKEGFIDTVYRQYPGTSYSELLKIN